MKLKPLGDRLIVRAIEEEEVTASGIVLPDTAKEKPQKGRVIAVGDGRFDEDGEKRIPLDVAEGDEVLYSKYGGTEIKGEGEGVLGLPGTAAPRSGSPARSCSFFARATSSPKSSRKETQHTWLTRN